MTQKSYFVVALLSLFLEKGTTSIRISKIKVPNYLEVGSGGELDCSWDSETDKMYSIKWYQAAYEFYRFTPSAKTPIQIFDTPLLDVDSKKSWGGSVWIANVTLAADGPFHCEVSGDAPTFHTASLQAVLNVIDIPDGPPVIQGIKSQYMVSDWIDITCISRRSKPPPKLTFTINDKSVIGSWIDTQIDQMDDDGLTTSSLQMRFSLLPRLIQPQGYARVRCMANIQNIYQDSVESVLTTLPPYQASVLDGGRATACQPQLCLTCLVLLSLWMISSINLQVL